VHATSLMSPTLLLSLLLLLYLMWLAVCIFVPLQLCV
jgi:hypothetical protein